MNKKQLATQAWENETIRESAERLGYETLSKFGALKRAAMEQLIADATADDEEHVAHSVVPAKYRATYVKAKSANGKSSLNCGDKVAALLQGMGWEQVCRIADAATGAGFGFHADKYSHLNAGMRRMNSGNKIRKLCKAATAA